MALKSKYGSLKKISIDALYGTFMGLSPREQTMALVGAVVVLLLVIILPISLASGKISNMEKLLKESQDQMGEVAREIDSYNTTKSKLDGLQASFKKGGDAKLQSTVEEIANKVGMKDNIQSINEKGGGNPTELLDESSVEVRISKVDLQRLIEFFYNIENDPARVLRVTRMDIKPTFANRQLLDASFDVSTFKLAGEE